MTSHPAQQSAHKVTEAQFQALVVEFAQWNGWRVMHVRKTRKADTPGGWETAVAYDGVGFPDLVLARHGTVILAELKSQRGQITPPQRQWGKAIGPQWRLWRPLDWPAIQEELKR